MSPTMDSTDVESQEPLLHNQIQASDSKFKEEASPPRTLLPHRDFIFTFLSLAVLLTTFACGIIASSHRDTLNLDTKLHLSHFNSTTNKCEISKQQTPESDFALVALVVTVSLSSLALTIPLSLMVVAILCRCTLPLFFLSAPFIPLLVLGLGLLWIPGFSILCTVWDSEVCATVRASSHIASWLQLLVISALAYLLRKNWPGSVEVLSMSTGFWKGHFVLRVANPLVLMGAIGIVNGPIFWFMWNAFNIGEIVPDFAAVNVPLKGCELGTGSSCCRAERPGWVYAYITFASVIAGFTALWVLSVFKRSLRMFERFM